MNKIFNKQNKENAMKRSMASLLVLGFFAFVANAETLYYNGASGNTPFITPGAWTNAAGTTATAITAADELVVSYDLQCNFSGNMTCKASKVRLGEVDGSHSAVFHHSSGVASGINLEWHNGIIRSQCYSRADVQPWTVTVDGSENGTRHLWCYNKKQTGLNDKPTYNIAWGVSGAFSGNANQIVEVRLTEAACTSDPLNYIQQFPFSGDSTGWLGKFVVSDCANFVLGHANAAGSPSAVRSDAITLNDHARFAVQTGVTPNAARGITIGGTDVRIMARTFPYGLTDCTDYMLNMPICGTYGFSKTGSGRVALGGAYTAGAIVVEEGTLEILGTATISPGTAITVKSGATLISHLSLSALEISQEEGATVSRVIDPLVVPFDNATTNAAAIVLPDDFLALTNVVQFALSEAIAIPQHESRIFKIMTYSGNATLTADMFDDASEKTFGLPKTSVSIVSEDGGQSVYLNMRPAVVSVADIPYDASHNINGDASTWSDGATVRPGADYVFTNSYRSYNGKADVTFNGGSLTLSGDSFSSSAQLNKLVLADGGAVTVWPPMKFYESYSGSRDHCLKGKICIPGNYGDSDKFNFETTYQDPSRETGSTLGSAYLAAELSGAGTLAVTALRPSGLNGLVGDNSAYKGRITMSGHDKDTLSSGMRVRVNSADNFGGTLDEFKFDALTLTWNAFLYPTNDISLADGRNRGLYVSGAGVECMEGVTFSCAWPLRLNGIFSKIGAGTLRLSGPISYGADGTGASGTMEVREGTFAALSDAAVAGLSVVFSNETTLAVGYGLQTGLTVAPTVNAGVVNLTVDADSLPVPAPKSVAITVATLPDGSADISGLFRLSSRAAKYGSFRLVKKSVMIEADQYDQYVLEANVRGMIISFK